MLDIFAIFFAAVVTENFVFYRFLGLCPFLAMSNKTRTAVGMGIAVTFVLVISNAITWLLQHFVLDKLGLPFLQYASFILVIASLVQFIEMYMHKYQAALYKAFGIYLPLITTNCVVLGLVLLTILKSYNFLEALIFAIGTGIGYTLALIIMSGIRERLDLADVPEALKGIPLALIITGLVALAFGGFVGMIK